MSDNAPKTDLALADFALALTKAVLQPSAYSRRYSADAKKRLDSLHSAASHALLDRSPEICFELSAPPAAARSDVVVFDGRGSQTLLSTLLPSALAATLSEKLTQAFRQHQILAIAVRPNLTRRELELGIEQLIEPDDQAQAPTGFGRWFMLHERHLIRRLSGRIHFEAELRLARLQRELKAAPAVADALNEPIEQVRARIAKDLLGRWSSAESLRDASNYLAAALSEIGERDFATFERALPSAPPREIRSAPANRSSSDPTPTASNRFPAVIQDLELAAVGLTRALNFEAACGPALSLWQFAKGERSSVPGGAALAQAALVRLGDPSVVTGLSDTMLGQGSMLGAAGELFALLEPDAQGAVAEDVLRRTNDQLLRAQALEALSRTAPDVPGLLRPALTDAGLAWQHLCDLIGIARGTQDPSYYDEIDRLLTNPRPEVRAEAILALGALDGKRAQRRLFDALDDEDVLVRSGATRALASTEGLEEVSVLRLLECVAEQSQADHLRAEAIRSLTAIAEHTPLWRERVCQILRTTLAGPSAASGNRSWTSSALPGPVLAAACLAIARIGVDKDHGLLGAYVNSSHPEVREAVQRALIELGGEG